MNDETTENTSKRTIRANESWWDIRLHQSFSLVAFSYIISTWIAPATFTLALAVLLYVVMIPVLVLFYAVTRDSGPQLPVPRLAVIAVLLGTTLSWGISTFVLDDVSLTAVLPMAFLVLSFGLIGWNVLHT